MDINTTFDPLAWGNIENGNDSPKNDCQVTNLPAVSGSPSDDHEKILAVGQELLAMGANIAESYSDWLRLGFALAVLAAKGETFIISFRHRAPNTMRPDVRRNGCSAWPGAMGAPPSKHFTIWLSRQGLT